jgi:uncharacterized protein YfeS
MSNLERKAARKVVAVLLAQGRPVKSVAAQVEMHERTIYRWLKQPKYAAYVDQLKNESVANAISNLSSNMSLAANQLAMLAQSADEKIALGASKSLLEMALKARASEETDKKIRELTERINALTAELNGDQIKSEAT